MKKIHLILFLFITSAAFSQIEDAWVYFKDKPDSQTYFDSPLTMLTQRALDRRITQNISLDISDVPIYQYYINQITSSTGITVKAKSKWLNCIHIRGTQADINALKLLPYVDRVDFANRLLNTAKITSVQRLQSEPINKTLETAVNFNYGTSDNQIQMLKGDLLHQQNYTGSGKIIAVLDSGFLGVDTAQPFQRLRDNNQILGGYDYVNKSTNFYAVDDHGTLVLSTMGGFTYGKLVGTAPDAQYYLYITEDVVSENPVEESNWVEAAEEADRVGVDIITSSLGYFGYDNPNYSHTYFDMIGNSAFASKGANIAFSKGILVVASAGNEGGTSEKHIGVPAEALNVLAVGAVDSSMNYAAFSSIGPSFDNRVKPDVMAQGKASVLSDVSGAITTANGTSFSCPILAGMAACLWQAFPTKTNQEIKQLVIQSADNYSPIIEDRIKYGYGIPDFSLALSNGLSVLDFSKNDFVVFPNPTSDSISVALAQGFDTGTVVFYTVLGQKVLEKKVSTQSSVISIKSLEKGTYLYKIESNGFSKSGKIVKK
jgi:hypothetical protein